MTLRESTYIPAVSRRSACASPPIRERRYTALTTTVLALVLAACGGAQHGDTYQASISKQEACCQGVGDPGRKAECERGIIRADSPDVAASDSNQATYACVESHFQCDPATGSITRAASQEVLDCINDLGQ